MDDILVDNLVIVSAIIYYLFLCLVYLLRAFQCDKEELLLALIFSFLLVPFIALWLIILHNGGDISRLLTLLPIIIYLMYDLWYRVITKKKPHHHPDHWPVGLLVYLMPLQIGSIGLNWYGFIVSKVYGILLIICYFIMLGFFSFYQNRYNKRKTAIKADDKKMEIK